MKTFVPKMHVLPRSQRALWSRLRGLSDLDFVLYGGTGVALRLGHRHSLDFDFFSDRPLHRGAIEEKCRFVSAAKTIQDEADAWSVLVPGGEDGEGFVKLSFFGANSFGRVGDPELTDDGVMVVASLEDLLATKLKVILQRVEAKDYQDIAVMINRGVSLARGLACARALYGSNFQPAESLKALVYFEGGDLRTLSDPVKRILIDEARSVRDLPGITLKSERLSPP